MHAVLLALTVFLVAASAVNEKRSTQATTCASPGTLDLSLCPSASEGAFCLTAAESGESADTCGCKQDADCFTSAAYPFCIKNAMNGGYCDKCYATLPASENKATSLSTIDHQFCRFRFPSKYLLSPPQEFADAGTSVPAAEFVASATTTSSYFREVCNRNAGQGGACEGCHQASTSNTPEIASNFPTNYPAGVASLGMLGSIHCRHVYATAPNIRPICAFRSGYFDNAFSPSVWTTLMVDNIIGEGGGVTGTSHSETRTVNLWQGACFPCVLGGSQRHGLCARADPTNPICGSNGGCGKCSTNTQCQVQSTCLTDGTCTGTFGTTVGQNCMANGECKTCTSDADCGALDGGETPNQATCSNGVCGDQPPCAQNSDCPANTNCNKDGKCVACTAGSGCRTNDGPPGTNADGVSGQPVCNNGVCVNCALNSQCSGTGGANCEADGTCRNCGNTLLGSAVCGAADGGAASPATLADANGQTLCNTNTQICESPCNGNTFCATKGGSDAFTRGANCQADGTCKDCTVSPNTCGALDGGENAGQTTCDPSLKLCYNPFSCSNNAACTGSSQAGGNNCQSNNQCINCVVTKTSTTCSGSDGGEVPGQPNCQTSTRQCIAACTSNANCVGTQGANCMANGVCFDCASDSDCATGNAWNGDLGGETVCGSGAICVAACSSNAACAATENCMKNGHCTACTSDSDCASNDGPPPMGTNTKCSSGRCVDPYQCVANSQDNSNCKTNTGQANCQADKTCKTCASNTDCGALDGGIIPGQPKCQSDGTCGPCTVNADCPASIPNCGADGSCYDCRTSGKTCGAADGGEVAGQANCDSRNGICTNFCTSDDNCKALECTPYCNIDKGCCVECTNNNHCPFSHWSGDEADKTECSDSWCVVPVDCWTDDDCPAGTPACVTSENTCVECLYDSHCSGDTPACSTSQEKCVECVFDDHCADLNTEDETFVCGTDQLCTSGSVVLSVISASVVAVLAAFALL